MTGGVCLTGGSVHTFSSEVKQDLIWCTWSSKYDHTLLAQFVGEIIFAWFFAYITSPGQFVFRSISSTPGVYHLLRDQLNHWILYSEISRLRSAGIVNHNDDIYAPHLGSWITSEQASCFLIVQTGVGEGTTGGWGCLYTGSCGGTIVHHAFARTVTQAIKLLSLRSGTIFVSSIWHITW